MKTGWVSFSESQRGNLTRWCPVETKQNLPISFSPQIYLGQTIQTLSFKRSFPTFRMTKIWSSRSLPNSLVLVHRKKCVTSSQLFQWTRKQGNTLISSKSKCVYTDTSTNYWNDYTLYYDTTNISVRFPNKILRFSQKSRTSKLKGV